MKLSKENIISFTLMIIIIAIFVLSPLLFYQIYSNRNRVFVTNVIIDKKTTTTTFYYGSGMLITHTNYKFIMENDDVITTTGSIYKAHKIGDVYSYWKYD